jgi:hypothetical protein
MEFCMRIARIAAVSLGLTLASLAHADSAAENHQTAVTIVAMEQVCNQAVPGLDGKVEHLLAREPVDAALKAEILKVQSDPRYKPQVDDMVSRLAGSPLGKMAVEKGTCKGYAAL